MQTSQLPMDIIDDININENDLGEHSSSPDTEEVLKCANIVINWTESNLNICDSLFLRNIIEEIDW